MSVPLILFVLSVVSAAPLRAQTDEAEPWVTFSPGAGTFSSASLAVTVRFSDDTSLNTATRVVVFNGDTVTGQFTHSAVATQPMIGVTTTSTATLTLQPGANTLSASICDNASNCASAASVAYTYVAGQPEVRVSPDGGSATAAAWTTQVHTFRVVNPGTAAGTYQLRPECRDAWTGSPHSNCFASSPSVSVAAGDSASVTVTATGTAPGRVLLVRMSAELQSMPGVSDAGWVDVDVVGSGGSAAAPLVQLVDLNHGAITERGECVTVAVAPGAAYECGDLRVAHALPVHRTWNRAWAPVLLYNSQHAHPRPTVYADVTLPAGGNVPTTVTATVTLADGTSHTASFAGSDWTPGATRRVAVQWDGVWMLTGLYAYTLQVTNHYASASLPSGTVPGEVAVVVRSRGPFGAGWWLAGWEQLVCVDCYSQNQRRLWVGGDGSTRLYTSTPGGAIWTAPQPDAPADTIYRAVNGDFVRKLPGGGRIEFNSLGQHVRTINRLGQTTTFDVQGGWLVGLQAPIPAGGGTAPAWVMSYASFSGGSRLKTVTATAPGAAPRQVTLAHGGDDWRVTGITDPDGLGVTFGHPAGTYARRIESVTDRRQTVTSFIYDAAGKLSSSRVRMGTVPSADDLITTFQAAEGKGVAHAGGSGASVGVPQAYTLLDGPRIDVADHTRLWLASRGAPRRIRNAVGAETIVNRTDARFPALVTQVLGPNARGDSLVIKSSAVYDARGRVSRARVHNPLGNGAHVDTWYTYDDRWDAPDTITAVGVGDVVMAYDTLKGNLLWRQQGGSTRRASYGYDSSGQLVRVVHPADAQGAAARDTMGYDARGNLAWTRTPLGFLTQHYRDALGRDTLVLSPIRADSSATAAQLQVAGMRSRMVYDAMGRVWMTETIGPETRIEWQGITASTKLSRTGAQSVTTRTTYDNGGLPLKVERWTSDATEQGIISSEYIYDAAGRKRAEKEGVTAWEYFTSDPAGNVVTWTTGRGHQITTQYDALGRQVRRVVPSVSYSGFAQPCWAAFYNDECPFPHFPNSGSGYVVPGDTSVFAYDGAGNMVYAANADAIVSRSYYPGGALRTDSLRIRSYGAGDFTQHVYGLSHRYDAQGRLRALEHPRNFTGSVAQADSFAYNTVGALARVTSRTGLQFSFRYDLLGRMVQDSFPGGQNTYVYDLDGRRKSRGGSVYHDSTRYDARGKALVSWVNGLPGQSTFYNHYSGLGNLVGTDWTNVSNGARNVEEMIVDGLGGVQWKRTASDQSAIAPEHSYTYAAGSTRLHSILFVLPSDAYNPAAYSPDNTNRTYDHGGNANRGSTIVEANGTGAGYSRTYTASFFSADERLRAYQNNHEIEPTRENLHENRGSFAEYFYDPLGRRIQVRTRRDGLCRTSTARASTVDCSSGIERYVWSGDNILWEMRGPGGNAESSARLNEISDAGQEYGIVGYTHAGGVDRPLVAWKGQGSVPATVVVPHLNWRGLFGKGTNAYGTATAAEIEWPGFQTTASHSRAPTQMPTLTWFGSVLEGQRDAGGQMYMRNRYYDPATGQFTQTDPIGIAGGLNTYGFADGDPVSYDDPYGLCPAPRCMGCPPPPCPEGNAGGSSGGLRPGMFIGATLSALAEGGRQLWTEHKDKVFMVAAAVVSRGQAGGRGNRLQPHPNAQGPHTTFSTNGTTGRINHYETYRPQTNPRNPNPWEPTRRVDVEGPAHFDKATQQRVPTPHTHRQTPSGERTRPARRNEVPNQ